MHAARTRVLDSCGGSIEALRDSGGGEDQTRPSRFSSCCALGGVGSYSHGGGGAWWRYSQEDRGAQKKGRKRRKRKKRHHRKHLKDEKTQI